MPDSAGLRQPGESGKNPLFKSNLDNMPLPVEQSCYPLMALSRGLSG